MVISWFSPVLFISIITYSLSGEAEKALLKSIKALYDSTVSKALTEAASAEFGNKLVNRFLIKINGKLKDLLSGEELDEDLMKKMLGILDMCTENCLAFKVAVTPKAATAPLTIVVGAIKTLHGFVTPLLEKMKQEKQQGGNPEERQPGPQSGQQTEPRSGAGGPGRG